MGHENAFNPTVEPSNATKIRLSGRSSQCNKQIAHCNGLPIIYSMQRIAPRFATITDAVSPPTIATSFPSSNVVFIAS